MEAKLTLKLDQTIIQSAKQYAMTNNRSLSRFVEDYFRNLLSENEPQRQFSPLVDELSDVISERDIETLD